ncbi:hypothetical protein DCAR_0104424 [Daucus carota subsp. sativus]|uniref:Uncharacterized protein n=1 Tax=Daucus carota subsp. sativus TaxID=79200 RepID=A0AAF0W9D4_DAUCS|nr:hypothetical protein DCAR_0104424 [Daucus carota subsp. sativus]
MPRSRINRNFIDKTFSIIANILLRIIPTTSGIKEAFTYYRDVFETSGCKIEAELINDQLTSRGSSNTSLGNFNVNISVIEFYLLKCLGELPGLFD